MKIKTFILAFMFTVPLFLISSAHADESVKVTLGQETYTLTKTKKGITRCKSNHVPDHKIEVAGLKNLTAPFQSGKPGPSCKNVIQWGKVSRCYQNHENQVLDDVLQWCNNI